MKYISLLIRGILAGCAISLGGIANICSQNSIAGSLFFVIGLFLVLTCNLNLFTGKICYALDNKPSYIKDLILIYLGNLIGCIIFGLLLGCVSKYSSILETFNNNLQIRIDKPFYEILILAFFCNILIYLAVDTYKNSDKEWKKVFALVACVSIFVLCGFEHCVADMFYIVVCRNITWKSFVFLMFVTFGNIIGGLTIPVVRRCLNKVEGKDK